MVFTLMVLCFTTGGRRTTDADVSVIVNSDVILTQSFVQGLRKVNLQFDAWFLTGARTDLSSLYVVPLPPYPQ